MIRRILDFTLILLFMWACMLIGLWLINEVIVPLELPGINNQIITATLKVAASVGLALLWLWIWREAVKRMFWCALRTQKRPANRREDEKPKQDPKRGKPKE